MPILSEGFFGPGVYVLTSTSDGLADLQGSIVTFPEDPRWFRYSVEPGPTGGPIVHAVSGVDRQQEPHVAEGHPVVFDGAEAVVTGLGDVVEGGDAASGRVHGLSVRPPPTSRHVIPSPDYFDARSVGGYFL